MVRQQSRFLNLMEGYSDSVKLYEDSLSAAGTANKKFAIWQESSQAKLEKFQATLQTIFQNSFDSGTIKDIITFGTELIEVISSLQKANTLLPVTVALITTIFTLLARQKAMALTSWLINIPSMIMNVITSLKGLRAASISATAAMNGLKIAMSTFLPVAIFTGLAYVIQKIIETKNEAKELQKTFDESISVFSTKQDDITKLQELSKEYDALNSKIKKSAEEEQKLIDIKNSIGTACSDLGIAYDAEGNAIINNSKQIQEYIDLKKQQLELDRQTIVETYGTESNKKTSSIASEKEEIKSLEAEYKNVINSKAQYLKHGGDDEGNLQAFDEKIKSLNSDLTDHRQKLFDAKSAYNDLNLALLNSIPAFMGLDNTIKNGVIVSFNKLAESVPNLDFNKFIKEIDLSAVKSYQDALVIFKQDGDINKFKISFDSLQESLIKTAGKFTKNKNEAKEMANAFLTMINPLAASKIAIDNFNTAIKKLANSSKNSSSDIISAFANLGINISKTVANILSNNIKLIESIKDVATAYDAFNQLAYEKSEQEWLAGGGNVADQRLFAEGWKARHPATKSAVIGIGQALESAKAITVETPNNFDGGSGGKDPYISDQYAISTAKLDQELKSLSYTKSKLSQTSEEYRNILLQEITISKQKQNLAHEEADRLRALRSQVAEGSKEYDEYTKSIQSLGSTWFDLQSNIETKTFERITSKGDELNKVCTTLSDKLSRIKSELSLLVPGTSEYNLKLQEQVNTTKEHIQALQALQTHYEIELASEALSIAQKDQLIAKIDELKQSLFSLQIDLTSQLAAQADEVISIYKSMYEQQKDIALDAIDAQIDAEEKRHKNVSDNLDDEQSQYEDLIKAKLKLLEKEADQESYTKKLTKAQKEAQEIQNKINILSLDDSFEGRAKKEQLEKELAEKLESIEEMQNQHTLDTRKDNLNDLLDANKKEINDKKKTEDAKYNLEKDRLENIKKETARYWDNMINDERKWAQLKVDIMNGNLDSVKDSFASFTNILNGNLEFLGSSIVRNLIDKMKLAKQIIDSINSQKNSLPSDDTNDDTNDNSNHSKYWKYKDIINEIIYLKDVWVNGDEGQKIWAANEATKYYNKLPNDVASLLKSMDFEKIKAWASKNVYHSGGIVGDNSSSPSYLTQLVNKLFNTNSNEQLIKALKNELYVPEVNLTKFFVPNMSKLISGLTPQVSVAGGGDTIYNLNFHVDKIENNDKGVDYIFKKINSGLSKLGK